MSDITEIVDLPDPAVQPLVHPLDLPEARGLFRKSWLVASLTSPPVGLCVAGIIWFASQNFVVPLIAGAVIIGFGMLASRFFRNEAWAFIPRKRQDRQRLLPVTWELGASLAFTAVLAVTLLLVTLRLDQPDVPVEIREFTFGMSAAAGLMTLADVVGKLLRYRGTERRRALFMVPGAVAVIGSIVVAYGVWFGSAGPGAWATVLWGVLVMFLAGIGVGIGKYLEHRRNRA